MPSNNNFFNDPEGEEDTGEDSGTFKFGEEEYTQEELQELVGLGKTAKEIQEEQNTDLSKVYPEYTRSRQEIKKLQDTVSNYEQEFEKLKAQTEKNRNTDGDLDEASIAKAKEAARKIGLVTVDDFDNYAQEKFQPLYRQQRMAEELIEKASELEDKYKGDDGRPKFEKIEMLEYMRDTGIQDPEVAYKVRYESDLDDWKQKQLDNAKKPGIATEKSSSAGSKSPLEVRPNRDNLDELVRQELGL